MGLLSGLFGGGGGGMEMPPMEMPSGGGGGGLAGLLGGGGGPSMPAAPPLPGPPPLPVGGPGGGMSASVMGNRPPPVPQLPIGPAEPVGQPKLPMGGNAGMNSIPGGPATSWRPQSSGQLVGQANKMLQMDTFQNLSQNNPQFQKIMQNLDGSLLKNVPTDSRPAILDNIGNLRTQLGNQLIPQLPGQSPQMRIGNQVTDNASVPLMPGQTAPPMPIGNKFAPQNQVPLIPGQSSLPTPGTTPDYMKMAHSMVGMNEYGHAKTLQSFFKQSLGQGVDPRSTAWCAAFANGVLQKNGLTGTGSLMARSFLGYGKPVDTKSLQQGDIAVFGRGKAPYGHVGFVDSVNLKNGTVKILSGNQNNAITLKDYPIEKALGFRRVNLGK